MNSQPESLLSRRETGVGRNSSLDFDEFVLLSVWPRAGGNNRGRTTNGLFDFGKLATKDQKANEMARRAMFTKSVTRDNTVFFFLLLLLKYDLAEFYNSSQENQSKVTSLKAEVDRTSATDIELMNKSAEFYKISSK